MVKKVFITDCEGPLTLNDNAYELADVFIEDGGKTLKFSEDVGPCLIIGENFTSWAAINFPGAIATKE